MKIHTLPRRLPSSQRIGRHPERAVPCVYPAGGSMDASHRGDLSKPHLVLPRRSAKIRASVGRQVAAGGRFLPSSTFLRLPDSGRAVDSWLPSAGWRPDRPDPLASSVAGWPAGGSSPSVRLPTESGLRQGLLQIEKPCNCAEQSRSSNGAADKGDVTAHALNAPSVA